MASNNFYQLAKINSQQIQQNTKLVKNNNEEHSDKEYSDEEFETNEVFNDNNEEFLDFKKNVKEWLTLDDDILTLQNAIKERKTKKNEITPKIMDFMDRFQINDLNTHNGKLKFTKSLQTKPLNKQFLISRLGDFFKDFGKGEKAATFILENRDKAERLSLRRIKDKKKEFNI